MNGLLRLLDFTRNEIQQILDTAAQMRRIVLADYKKGPQLIGHIVGGVWRKPCTSSIAFQLAAAYLSGTCVPVFGADDEQSACFTLADMGANTVVTCGDNASLFRALSLRSRCKVVNGGSSQYDPIGVLADLLTLYIKVDTLSNLNVLVLGNRDVNKVGELMHCLQQFGSSLVWYLPADDIVTVRRGIVLDNIKAAFKGADAVLDLGLAPFSDAERYYGNSGGISRELLDLARLNCPLLGCKTVVEGGTAVREYEHNALSVRESCYVSVVMAVLYLLQRG